MSAAAVPQIAEEVTADWLTGALRGRWPAIEVRGVEAESLGEGIGQMSVLKRLTLDHGGAPDAPRCMILKLHTPFPDMRAVADRYHMFEREVNFYQRFADRVPVRTPEVFYAALDGAQSCVLLMEDMSDWRSPNQIEGPAPAQVELAVDRLAALTGRFWGSAELSTESEWLPDWTVGYMRAGADDYRACVPEYLRRFESQALPHGARHAVETIATRMDDLLDQLAGGHQVLTHYDYRVENMFFEGNGKAADLCLVDWQLVMRGRIGWDYAYLIGTNLPVEARAQLDESLRERYLAGLRAAGVSGYTRSDLDHDVALNTMAMTTISVIGGANADLSNPRNEALFAAIASRSFSAVLDGNCLDALP